MFHNRPLLFLGLAIGIALFTTILIYNWLQQQRQHAPTPVEQKVVTVEGVPVAVASTDLAWGTPLTKDVVRLVPFPQESLPAGHFKSMEALKGRVLLSPVQRNEPILEAKLAPVEITSGGVIAVLDPHKRAMAVKVNEVVALPGFIKPGDRVDVMATFANAKHGQMTKTVLENMRVLATDTQLERGSSDEKPRPVRIITLEVSLEEAEKLAMASNGGQLRLALRSPLNAKVEKTRGATFRDLMTSFRVAPKRRATVRKRTQVEIIKGNARSVVRF